MRIASLVPSATEILYALGLGDCIVAVTHECDHPSATETLPQLTRSRLPEGLDAAGIDAAVRAQTGNGEAIYELDEDMLDELAPDLIVTQAVCAVCAVSFDDVRAAAERIDSRPSVISLDPSTLGEVMRDIRTVADAAGVRERGDELLGELGRRIDRVTDAVRGEPRPAVAALEWLDPPYVGGHWVPQMIELAGGEDVLGFAGERSHTVGWPALEAAGTDIVVAMPCGYSTERAAAETSGERARLARLGARRVVAVDASSYFSRPGPRLVDGIELLAHVLHPDRIEAPPPGRLLEIDTALSIHD
ncbi:MAG: cobalamin-binding protein [Thermoleophilaceae bacterium]